MRSTSFNSISGDSQRFLRHGLALALLAAAIWLGFGDSLDFGFVWDDDALIVNSEFVKRPGGFHEAFGRTFWSIGENAEDPTRSFYRPMVSVSYALDYRVWGLNPRGFHLTNIAWHCLCAGLVYAMGLLLLGRPLPALAGALLFALHPTRVENVCWISGRTDLFCGAFVIAALCLVLVWARSRIVRLPTLAGILACYTLGLLSKETAIVFPLMLAVLFLACRRRFPRQTREWGALFALVAAVTVGYLVVRWHVLGAVAGPAVFGHWSERVASIGMVFVKYLGLLALVVPTDPHHADGFLPLLSPSALAYGVLCLGYLALVLWSLRKGRRMAALFLLWIPVSLLPVFNLGRFGDILLADRFLYIPSIGFCLGLGWLIFGPRWLWLEKASSGALGVTIRVGLLIPILGLMAWQARLTAGRWLDDVSLFSYAATTSPRSAYIHFNLGRALSREGDHAGALRAHGRAVELQPDHMEAHLGMGHAFRSMGRWDESISALLRALRLTLAALVDSGAVERSAGTDGVILLVSGGDVQRGRFQELAIRQAGAIQRLLGEAYRRKGDLVVAERWYRTSLQTIAGYEAHNDLGEIALARGDLEMAHTQFQAALAIKDTSVVRNNLGVLFERLGEAEKAEFHLRRALAAGDEELSSAVRAAVRYGLARNLFKRGRVDEAREHAREALLLIRMGHGPAKAAEEMEGWLRGPDGETVRPEPVRLP